MVELQLIEGHWQFVIYEPFKHGQHKVRFSDVGRVFFLIKVLDRNARGAAMLETIKNAIKNRQYIFLLHTIKSLEWYSQLQLVKLVQGKSC